MNVAVDHRVVRRRHLDLQRRQPGGAARLHLAGLPRPHQPDPDAGDPVRAVDGLRGVPALADPRAVGRRPTTTTCAVRDRRPEDGRDHHLGRAAADGGDRGLLLQRRAVHEDDRRRHAGRDRGRRDRGPGAAGPRDDEAARRLELVGARPDAPLVGAPRLPRGRIRPRSGRSRTPAWAGSCSRPDTADPTAAPAPGVANATTYDTPLVGPPASGTSTSRSEKLPTTTTASAPTAAPHHEPARFLVDLGRGGREVRVGERGELAAQPSERRGRRPAASDPGATRAPTSRGPSARRSAGSCGSGTVAVSHAIRSNSRARPSDTARPRSGLGVVGEEGERRRRAPLLAHEQHRGVRRGQRDQRRQHQLVVVELLGEPVATGPVADLVVVLAGHHQPPPGGARVERPTVVAAAERRPGAVVEEAPLEDLGQRAERLEVGVVALGLAGQRDVEGVVEVVAPLGVDARGRRTRGG